MLQKFEFSIELFDTITGKWILENRKEFTYKCFSCKTINTINFNEACNKGMMNFIYQKIMNKNMRIKQSKCLYNPIY